MRDYNFGNIIFELRKQKQLTQSELGEILGISNKTISKWENGTTKPGIEMLYKISEYFEISVDELVSGRLVPRSKDIDGGSAGGMSEWHEHAEKLKADRALIIKMLLIILAAAALLTVSTLLFIDLNKRINVPDVVGYEAATAKKTLERLGLRVEIVFEYSYTVDNGAVISQSIKSGKSIKINSKIVITVSAGIEKKEVPPLIGLTAEQAEEMLADLGFETEIKEEFNSSYAKGTVCAQKQKAGTKLKTGSKITITVSKGMDWIKTPHVTGLTKEQAETLLYNAGFKVFVDIRCSDTVSEGTVMAQSIKDGDTVGRGSTVMITVSAGAANKTGNTNSNAVNGGYVALQGNWIYYLNTGYDNCLYKMRNDGSEKQLITTDAATQINVVGEWIYYSAYGYNGKGSGVYKIKIDGTNKTQLSSIYVTYMMVVQDKIYYIPHENYNIGLWSMDNNGENVTQLVPYKCFGVNIIGDRVYYLQAADPYIHTMLTNGSMHEKSSYDYPNITDMFGEDNFLFISDGTSLKYMSLPHCNTSQLCEWSNDVKRSLFNYHEGKIYYLETAYAENITVKYIGIMNTDGTNAERLSEIRITNFNYFINTADGWIYFPNADDNGCLYRVKTDGTGLQKIYN